MNSFYFLIFLGLCSSSLSISENPSSESILYIRLGEEMFSVNLYDSPIRRELISLLNEMYDLEYEYSEKKLFKSITLGKIRKVSRKIMYIVEIFDSNVNYR